ncbi:unnamed protein product [Bathycoccus prasinos]
MTTKRATRTKKTVSSVSLKDRTNDFSSSMSSKGAEELEEESENERSFESDWSRDENPYDASNSFLTKIIKTHKKAMETSEDERRRLKELLFKAEDRCEELLEMNEHLERELEKKEKKFRLKMEEEKTKGKQFPEREKMEIRERKLESELQAVKTMNESLERQVLSLKIREREREDVLTKLRDETAKMKSSNNHRNASAATTEQMLRDEIRSEEQKEQQTLAVIAETYAIEIRKLKEKVEMYEKARMREKAFGFQQKHQQQQREKQKQYFSFEESEDGEENDDEPRPPLTVAKRLPSESESPFGTLNSEGRVKAAIVRLGILDDNGDVPKMRSF